MNKPIFLYTYCLSFLLLLLSSLAQAGVSEIVADKQSSSLSHGQNELPLPSTKTSVEDPTGEGFTFIPKVTTGVMYLGYEEITYGSDKKTVVNTLKRSDNLPFVGIGGVIHWRRWSTGVYAQMSDKGQSNEYKTFKSSTTQFNTYDDSEFRLTDYSVNVDYEVFNHFSVSAGYKMTKLELSSIETTLTKTGTATTFTGKEPQRDTFLFETRGPSLGISYDWSLNEDMSLGTSLARGRLKGKKHYTEKNDLLKLDDQIPHSTSGVAMGISFNHRLPRHHLRYVISVEYYKYKMKVDQDTTKAGLQSSETKEKLGTLKATLIWEF